MEQFVMRFWNAAILFKSWWRCYLCPVFTLQLMKEVYLKNVCLRLAKRKDRLSESSPNYRNSEKERESVSVCAFDSTIRFLNLSSGDDFFACLPPTMRPTINMGQTTRHCWCCQCVTLLSNRQHTHRKRETLWIASQSTGGVKNK